jgi:multisite-specific tRNA:(cytosine-C5)-methyltransferase
VQQKNRRGGDKSKSQDVWAETAPATLTSEKFEAYYRAQGVVPEDQWPALLEAARRPLPVSFRVAGSRQ